MNAIDLIHTHEHHPLCDDNGWDHLGPCVVETDFYDDDGRLMDGPPL